MCRPSEEGSLSPQRGTMRGDLLCSAACPSPPHHVSSHHSPMRAVGAILAQSLLSAGSFANGRPWHLALKPHPPLLAHVQEDAVSPSLWTLWDVLGDCPKPLWGLPVQ